MIRRFLTISPLCLALACAAGKDDKKKSSSGDGEGSGEAGDADASEPDASEPDAADAGGPGEGEGGEGGDDGGTTGGKPTPVLAFFGGYTSCGTGSNGDPNDMDLKKAYDQVNAALKTKLGAEPKFLISCFTAAYESVFYRTSGSDELKNEVITGMESDFNELLAGVDTPQVLLVGHSYGGWTAMDVAKNLPATVKLKGLVTLDPISHVDCDPESFILATFGGATEEGCTRAPQDFGEAGIAQIAKKAEEWLNYYQTKVEFLHSGEIKAAKNFLRTYEGDSFAPHNAFILDEAIFDEIETLADHAFVN